MVNSADFNLPNLIRSYQNPHGLYAALRSQDPLYYDSMSQSWLVTGHKAIMEILSDSRFSSELNFGQPNPKRGAKPPFWETSVNKQIIFADGDFHRQVQNIILHQLARMKKDLPAHVHRVVTSLLENIRDKSEFDLVDDFAAPLSLLVIAHVLGLSPANLETLRQLSAWSDTHGDVTSGYLRVDIRDIDRLGDYFHKLLAQKRQTPTTDLISAFLKPHDVFANDDEIIANCMMVFGAGRGTTRKLIGNGIPMLIPHWQTWREAFQADPTISKQLTEELLRMVTPTRYLFRQATQDVDLSGQFPGNHRIRRGDKIMLFLEAANRDPDYFLHPDTLDPQRQPNRHLAFGFGPHHCPGAKLARLEIQTALEMLFTTFANLQSKRSSPPAWNPNPNIGGYTAYGVCPVRHAA
ncbi:MAG: cytochrome P450 [Anaerolineae bacterium]|nr:cytochrome P450 [Anaerolineae bacterium]